MSSKPIAIDLFCGLGGWAEGLLAEGFDVIGFDIEQRPYPAQLVLQDVLTLHGSQFKDAALIVASPPCQEYSYMAMPWTRAKKIAAEYRSGEREIRYLTRLFDACFVIQAQAMEASGRFIPLIVENVCGAQKWVGRAKWHYGSYYLWGDVPALMPFAKAIKVTGFRFDGSGKSFQSESVKVSGLNWSGSDKPGYVAKAFNTTAEQRALKTVGHVNKRDGYSHTRHLTNQRESDAVKGENLGWFNDAKRKDGSSTGYLSQSGSRSNSRKAASALIAKIPYALARHIAHVYYPRD